MVVDSRKGAQPAQHWCGRCTGQQYNKAAVLTLLRREALQHVLQQPCLVACGRWATACFNSSGAPTLTLNQGREGDGIHVLRDHSSSSLYLVLLVTGAVGVMHAPPCTHMCAHLHIMIGSPLGVGPLGRIPLPTFLNINWPVWPAMMACECNCPYLAGYGKVMPTPL